MIATMKALFNLLFTAGLIVLLGYRIWENVQQPHPDGTAIFLQVVLLLFGIGLFIYRVLKFRNSAP